MTIGTIPDHFGIQYATGTTLLLQQKGSKFRKAVETGNYKGEQASPIDQIGQAEVQSPTGRFAPIGRIDIPVDRPWLFPTDKDLPLYYSPVDMLRLLNDNDYLAKSQTVSANAFGKFIDDLIITGFFADRKTGKTGSTTTTFGTPNTGVYDVADNFEASAVVGMTVDKLLKGREILQVNEVDLDQEALWTAISPQEERQLLRQIEVTSQDYRDSAVLENGRIRNFLGINFIVTNRLTKVSTTRYCPMWVASGMHLGTWEEMNTAVNRDVTLSGHPWQVYTKGTYGVTRTEEGKVIRINCATG